MAAGPPMSEQAVRVQLGKVLSSRAFAKGERSRDFLRYIVDKTLQGRSEEIKEYTIALEVLHRGAGYDPHVDATVRVEASRLREKLRQYYTSAGIHEEICIDVPVGTYVPVLTQARSATENAGAKESETTPSSTRNGVDSIRVRFRLVVDRPAQLERNLGCRSAFRR